MACSARSGWAERVALVGPLLLGCGPGTVLPAGAPPLAVLPFDFSGGLIYVRGVVNRDSAWLILDTGTSKTGVDREWAWSVGAVPVMAPGAPPQAAETVATALVDTIRLGGLELRNYPVALYHLRAVSEASGRPTRGFLGHDFLEQFTVEIDYRERHVRLYDPARYRYAGSGSVAPFASEGDHPLLRGFVTVAGRRPIPARLLLDTGASVGSGGNVISADGVGATEGRTVGEALGSGSATTGLVSDSIPPARAATPSAVSSAGSNRTRMWFARSAMGAAW